MSERGQDTRTRILDTAQALVLEKGFAATSLDDIIKATGLTKGAFFHHFRSKADLAQKLIGRFAENDFAIFAEWSRTADALADDPFQALMIFLKLFEDWLDNLPEPFAGCLFAVFVYESRLFEPEINEFIKHSLQEWQGYYERKFEAILATRRPRFEVTAHELAEAIVSLLEGAFILARSYGDPGLISRQSRLFREQLKLLFEPAPAPAGA